VRIIPPKKEKFYFMSEEFSVGLEVSPRASVFFVGDKKTYQYMTAFVMKTLVWIRIRIGSGFNNSLDPDLDSAQCLDPDLNSDSVNPDPKHFHQSETNTDSNTFFKLPLN
jgi:hypothetical protein